MAGLTHYTRCWALSRAGNRCDKTAYKDRLCRQHLEFGAIIPDDWTQPNNIPVFYLMKNGNVNLRS